MVRLPPITRCIAGKPRDRSRSPKPTRTRSPSTLGSFSDKEIAASGLRSVALGSGDATDMRVKVFASAKPDSTLHVVSYAAQFLL